MNDGRAHVVVVRAATGRAMLHRGSPTAVPAAEGAGGGSPARGQRQDCPYHFGGHRSWLASTFDFSCTILF